jgi:hypothetical protein
MKKQIYKGVFKVYDRKTGSVHDRLLARFSCDGGEFKILEDHLGIFEDSLPEGEMTDLHFKFLDSIRTSPYLRLLSEEQINSGEHDDMIDDLDIMAQPKHEFLLYDEKTNEEPIKVHVFDSNWVVNGKQLLPHEKDLLIKRVQGGELTIHNI